MSGTLRADGAVRRERASGLGFPIVLLGLASLGWLHSVRMSGGHMQDLPAETMALASYLVGWTAMMGAMMFPAIVPAVRLYGRAASAGNVAPLPFFVAGYLVVWAAAGVPGYLGARAISLPQLHGHAGYIAGGTLLAAAVWQLTPLKNVCLRHCRSPMSFFLRSQGRLSQPSGAVRVGATHGAYCLACCWALMAVLVAVGTMNIAWMVGLSVLIFIERNAPRGEQIGKVAAVLGAGLGIAMIVEPTVLTVVT